MPSSKRLALVEPIYTVPADPKRERKRKRRILAGLLLCVCLLLALVLGIALPLLLVKRSTTTTTKTTTMTTASSTRSPSGTTLEVTTKPTTSTTTSTTSTTTTSIDCAPPLRPTPAGDCVNILIDFFNCGSVGYVCPSNYTSCSAGECGGAPVVQLTDAIPIFTAALNGSVDDKFYNVTLPFNITLYDTSTDRVQVTTNGVLCLGGCSTVYTETILPTVAFPGATALAYWDDLYVYNGTEQGIYYKIEGDAPNRTVTFEYYCSHFQQPEEYYQFQMVFFENNPGVVQYIYYVISDLGVSCTVGVQAATSGPYMQHSFQQVNAVVANMTITYDTNAGTVTVSNFS